MSVVPIKKGRSDSRPSAPHLFLLKVEAGPQLKRPRTAYRRAEARTVEEDRLHEARARRNRAKAEARGEREIFAVEEVEEVDIAARFEPISEAEDLAHA